MSPLSATTRPASSLPLVLVALAGAACGETTISITDPAVHGAAGAGDTAEGLSHHYPFDGVGTVVTDVVGAADGRAVNATLANGSIVLAGGTSDQYVELPAGLVSGGSSATLEVWVTWNDTTGDWQRILDFGSSDMGTGVQGMGQTYLFLSPRDDGAQLSAVFSVNGHAGEAFVDGTAPLSAGTLEHLAVVVDGAASQLSLYSNGSHVGSAALLGSLLDLNDENAWVGRSQFALDVEFAGAIHDLKIFSLPRNASQIAASFAAGPDAAL